MKSKVEAYCYLLKTINELYFKNRNTHAKYTLELAVIRLRLALCNHEQDIANVLQHIIDIKPAISSLQGFSELENTIAHVQRAKFDQTGAEKWENTFGRVFESTLAITFLTSPTPRMLEAVDRVSRCILATFAKLYEAQPDYAWCEKINEIGCIAFGKIKDNYTYEDIKEALSSTTVEKLPEIMFLQTQFAMHYFRGLPYIATESGSPAPSKELREYHLYRIYYSPLYTSCKSRGRDVYAPAAGNYLGIMQKHQAAFAPYADLRGEKPWEQDCLSFTPVLDPNNDAYAIVGDQLDNDVPYVSGFSGMVSMLLPAMIDMCDKADNSVKRDYIAVLLSYIVGGGYHNIHEVLAPCQYSYGLIPGYEVSVPDQEIIAKAPKYNKYFALMCEQDPEFRFLLSDAFAAFDRELLQFPPLQMVISSDDLQKLSLFSNPSWLQPANVKNSLQRDCETEQVVDLVARLMMRRH